MAVAGMQYQELASVADGLDGSMNTSERVGFYTDSCVE